MVTNALIFLIESAAGFFTVTLLLRFLMQWARAAPRNPLSDFVNAITNWAVRPARRVIPSLRGLDLSTLVLAWLTQFLQLFLVLQLVAGPARALMAPGVAMMLLLAVLMVVRLLLYMIIVIVIVQAVLSWVNPYSPLSPLLNTLVRPFLRPFQRRIPPVANVDLSPLFVIIVCQLLLILLANVI